MENKQKQALFKHLRETGNISESCEKADINRDLYYRLYYRDKEFRESVNRAKANYILKDSL